MRLRSAAAPREPGCGRPLIVCGGEPLRPLMVIDPWIAFGRTDCSSGHHSDHLATRRDAPACVLSLSWLLVVDVTSMLLFCCAALTSKAISRRWQLHLRIDMGTVGKSADVVILATEREYDRSLRSGDPRCGCSGEAHAGMLVVSAMKLGARMLSCIWLHKRAFQNVESGEPGAR